MAYTCLRRLRVVGRDDAVEFLLITEPALRHAALEVERLALSFAVDKATFNAAAAEGDVGRALTLQFTALCTGVLDHLVVLDDGHVALRVEAETVSGFTTTLGCLIDFHDVLFSGLRRC